MSTQEKLSSAQYTGNGKIVESVSRLLFFGESLISMVVVLMYISEGIFSASSPAFLC